MTEQRGAHDYRRRSTDGEVPDWAVELMRSIGSIRTDVAGVETRLGSRLARIEGIGAAVAVLMSRVIAASAAGWHL